MIFLTVKKALSFELVWGVQFLFIARVMCFSTKDWYVIYLPSPKKSHIFGGGMGSSFGLLRLCPLY